MIVLIFLVGFAQSSMHFLIDNESRMILQYFKGKQRSLYQGLGKGDSLKFTNAHADDHIIFWMFSYRFLN